MRLTYVSNLAPTVVSGGFSGMNVAMLRALRSQHEVSYVGPIHPPPFKAEHLASKLRRAVGRQGKFFFFSPRRLSLISSAVQVALQRGRNDATFFHGFTPWIAFRCPTPYFAWSDCTFRDYMNVYHQSEQFEIEDLHRITAMEADWLRSAEKVLFTSQWALEGAMRDYNLESTKLASVGVPITQNIPFNDAYTDRRDFAFISTDFAAKGGLIVAEAIGSVRCTYPEARLIVVGDLPPKHVRKRDGVLCTGFLHREDLAQQKRWQQIFSTVRALVHPTRADIAPLLFAEAASFGCPVIASRRFAIPEMVIDGETGLLLNDHSVAAVADAMEQMLGLSDANYSALRRQARQRAQTLFTPEQFQRRVAQALG